MYNTKKNQSWAQWMKPRNNQQQTHGRRPKLVVFDLDNTLWPFCLDIDAEPPFRMGQDGYVYDVRGRLSMPYPESRNVLLKLFNEGYVLGIASRTGVIHGAEQLLDLYDINRFFTYKQIYPGSKVNHFRWYHQITGIPYSEMLFFDDDLTNINEVCREGVTCIQVDSNGVTHDVVREGLLKFARGEK